MPAVRLTAALPEDLDFVGEHLRAADRLECGLVTGQSGIGLVRDSAERSRWCHVARLHGEPFAVWGVVPYAENPRWAAPWLLATEAIVTQRRAVAAWGPAEVELMLAGFPYLTNYVHDRNQAAIAWLMRLGFHFDFSAAVTRHGAQRHLPFFRGLPYV